jgi:prophage regulatory protein
MNSASPHSDPAFPKSINLGGGAVGWIESEVQDWIAGCISASRGGEDGKLVKVINPVSNLT